MERVCGVGQGGVQEERRRGKKEEGAADEASGDGGGGSGCGYRLDCGISKSRGGSQEAVRVC